MDTISLWQMWCIAGVILCIIEIFTPVLFFLNIGFACFCSAIVAAFGFSLTLQVICFAVFSAIFSILIYLIIFVAFPLEFLGDRPFENFLRSTQAPFDTRFECNLKIVICFGLLEWFLLKFYLCLY